ncbi:MAG: hypothetical protein EAZ36_03600, partial [Verrucomicrobia bacterium]
MSVATANSSLWESAKIDLRSLFPEDVFQLWFDPVVCLDATPDQLTLGVPTDFAAIWINDNYIDLILQRLRLTAGREVKVVLRKIPSAAHPVTGLPTDSPRPRPSPSRRPVRTVEERIPANTALNLRNTFDTFVVGDHNQMAAAAARARGRGPPEPVPALGGLTARAGAAQAA